MLLKETPPEGSKFMNGAKHILEREEIWNKWKNEGCPNYVKEKKLPAQPKTATKRPRLFSSDFVPKTNKVFVIDNSEISKLCNINHDNLEACKDPNRQFLPYLKEFFEEAIEQLDPSNQVEKQYQLIYHTDWSWKALRLLAKRSAFYFMQNQNVKTISEYLEAICLKLKKEFSNEQQQLFQAQQQQLLNQQQTQQFQTQQYNQSQNSNLNQQAAIKQEQSQQQTANQNLNTYSNNAIENLNSNESENSQQGNEDELVQINDDQSNVVNSGQNTGLNSDQDAKQNVNETKVEPIIENIDDINVSITKTEDSQNQVKKNPLKDILNSELIDFLAENIEDVQEWKHIAVGLKMDEDTISFIESEIGDVKQQSKKIFQLWKEREEIYAIPNVLLNVLYELGRTELAKKFQCKLNQFF